MDATDPVNKPLVKAWAQWALVWLTFFPLVGVLVSIQFHNPEFLGGTSWFTFGRLRPVHTNGVIFGSFTTAFIGLLYYFVPRLCGTPLYKAEWGWWLIWMWNAFLVLGSLSLLMGYIIGVENAEFEWPLNVLRYLVFVGITIQVLGTIFRRRVARFYVSLWYTLAAAIWTLLNLLIGNVLLPYGPISGANNAAMHGLYIHYVVGLWMTPAGLATIYYFLPLAAKNALYSHKLSLLGFWSLALFYPLVGTHHYLYSPIPHWTQTVSIVHSMWMILPVFTVIVNFFGTMQGRWGTVLGGDLRADGHASDSRRIGIDAPAGGILPGRRPVPQRHSPLSLRYPSWGWSLLGGIVSLFPGILLWTEWPGSALWFIGMCIGIDMIFHGWGWVMLALAVRAAGSTDLPGSHQRTRPVSA